jgi:hypothetical protein
LEFRKGPFNKVAFRISMSLIDIQNSVLILLLVEGLL